MARLARWYVIHILFVSWIRPQRSSNIALSQANSLCQTSSPYYSCAVGDTFDKFKFRSLTQIFAVAGNAFPAQPQSHITSPALR